MSHATILPYRFALLCFAMLCVALPCWRKRCAGGTCNSLVLFCSPRFSNGLLCMTHPTETTIHEGRAACPKEIKARRELIAVKANTVRHRMATVGGHNPAPLERFSGFRSPGGSAATLSANDFFLGAFFENVISPEGWQKNPLKC